MADLDNKAKRFSGMNVNSPWRSILPDADGSFGQADRQHLEYQYAGILFGAGGGPTFQAAWARFSNVILQPGVRPC